MEQQLAFLKRHAFVIAGVGLPLLLIAALLVARAVPRFLVEDPRFGLVYTVEGDDYRHDDRRVQDVSVAAGRLVVRWNLVERPNYQPRRRVYRADPLSGELLELAVPEPEVAELEASGGRAEIALEGLAGLRVDTQPVSPDGWSFASVYGGGGGIFGELFFHGHGGLRVRIEKDGRRIDVPRSVVGYGAIDFVGWLVPEGETR